MILDDFIILQLSLLRLNLAQYIESQVRLSVKEALSLQKDICRGLAQAHKMTPPVVHRDIKPNNILLLLHEGKFSAKVGDFGLAKHVDSETRLITAGGTLAYMPPEGFWNYQSSASDVFSAGIVFYMMLTGVPPYVMPDETYTQKAVAEAAIQASRNKIPPPPSSFNSDLDKEIDKIVLKALAIDMKDRYQDAGEFLDAITSYEKSSSDGLYEVISQAMSLGKQYATLSKAVEILEEAISKQSSEKKSELLLKYGHIIWLEERDNDVINIVFLLITEGPMQGHRFAIKSSAPVIIGRGEDVTINIPYDTFCSRRHAQITSFEKKYYLEDLKSTNGTYLNDVKVERVLELRNNDKIKFGNTEAVFLIKEINRNPNGVDGMSSLEIHNGFISM